MNVRTGGKGSAWKLCIGLAVLCGVLVFAAGFLHRSAVASAIDAQQTKSVSYVHGKLATAVGNDKLTKELGDRAAADLRRKRTCPRAPTVRLYALDGTPVFSSGRPGAGDPPAIAAAAKGEIGSVIDGSGSGGVRADREQGWQDDRRRSRDERHRRGARRRRGTPRWAPVAADRARCRPADRRSGADGARRFDPRRFDRGRAAKGDAPVATKAPKEAVAPVKSRVSGFAPAPALVPTTKPAPPSAEASESVEVEAPPERARKGLRLGRKAPKETAVPETSEERCPRRRPRRSHCSDGLSLAAVVPEPADEPASSPMTPDREAAILRMLEDQLEQLRMKIKTQEETAASATRQLQEELDAATRRANEAEARVGCIFGCAPVRRSRRARHDRTAAQPRDRAGAGEGRGGRRDGAGRRAPTNGRRSVAGSAGGEWPRRCGRAGRGACTIGRRRAADRRGATARGRGRAARGLQRVRPRRAGGSGRTARREGGRAGAEGDRARDPAAGSQRRRRRGAG